MTQSIPGEITVPVRSPYSHVPVPPGAAGFLLLVPLGQGASKSP